MLQTSSAQRTPPFRPGPGDTGTPPRTANVDKDRYAFFMGLDAGFDMYDGLCLGLSLGRGQQNARFALGTWGTGITTFAGYYNWHFNGRSRLTYRKHFYLGGGYQNIFENDEGKNKYYGYVKGHLGLDINFSMTFGAQLEVGLAYNPFSPKEPGFLSTSIVTPTISFRFMLHSRMVYE